MVAAAASPEPSKSRRLSGRLRVVRGYDRQPGRVSAYRSWRDKGKVSPRLERSVLVNREPQMSIVQIFAAISEYLGTLMVAGMLIGGLTAVWFTSKGSK